ncbi:MAG: hypothetical protein EBU75_11185, partial [Betaproteobacteria bacterium]|nr:hypothetical protein [Betaproteobacteria bacterium]
LSGEAIGVEDGLPVTLSISGGRLAAPLVLSSTVAGGTYFGSLTPAFLGTLGGGDFVLTATASDAAGNPSAPVRANFRIDLSPLEGGLEPLSSSALSATKAAVYSQSFAANTLATKAEAYVLSGKDGSGERLVSLKAELTASGGRVSGDLSGLADGFIG